MDSAKQRKQIFINHPIQWQYLRMVTLASLLPTLFLTVSLYFLIWQTVASEVAVPELMSQIMKTAWQKVNLIILISSPMVIVVFFYWALVVSHRMAGPLARLDHQLDEMIETRNFAQTLKVRETDLLYSLISKVDRLIKLIRENARQ